MAPALGLFLNRVLERFRHFWFWANIAAYDSWQITQGSSVAKVFISHRSADLDLAKKLSAELRTRGNDVWLDDERLLPGDSIVHQVEAGLLDSGYVILCLSAEGPSEWTDREWMSTLARRLSGVDVKLLPVLLSGGSLPPILADIKCADLTGDWDQGISLLCSAFR